MPFERKEWDLYFEPKTSPGWLCPTCRKHTLRLERDTMRIFESRGSKSFRTHDAWEPEWIHKRFVCFLRCRGKACNEPVLVAGYTTTELVDTEHGPSYFDFLYPLFVDPPLAFFKVPKVFSDRLKEEVERAFALLWCDPGSSAGRVRCALELLMDFLVVPKRKKRKDHTFRRLSLHERILAFQLRNQNLGDCLLALKWIGNTGSHIGEVKQGDVFDAFQILSHVLEEVAFERTKRLAELTQRINKTKGPLSLKRRKRKR